ncbi:hypothetical protein C8A01DRAFT_38859 [Parachaetomium inaequale]|uniref:SET domain-containing protein n=1 Tax=Parachaetomium inaequale TaxID=2588326 RepID=A0AAN6PC18_9PEZI|nr:hypothetical protein C8A01DRAFT_38859 [Parachaetomium inaequale]
MNERDKARFDTLLAWSRQHGAELHPSLEIYHDDISKYSLRVKPSAEGLQPGFGAVSCPAATTLSYLNALVDGPIDPSSPSPQQTGAFPPRFTQSVPPHVLGRFFLIKEYLKAEDSFWWPYLATLPSPEQVSAWALPAFWPDDDIAYLEGTNAHVAIDEIQANVKREFKQARKLLKEEDFPDVATYTQLLYKWAFTIFTSRSFRPSLILSDTTKQHLTPLLPDDVQLDDFSILQPLLDIANHSMTARYAWDTTTTTPSACRLICRDPYQPGEQVYNNYGLKTNSELLLGYGFLLPETEGLHNDYVHVRKRQQQDVSGNEDEPKTFLISLRPVAHDSSLVGRSRVSSRGPASRLALLPCFAHFEPALVEDLAGAVANTPELRRALERCGVDGAGRGQGAEVGELVERVRGALGGKVQYDYERLMEVEEGLPPPGNRNQVLATEYRAQCAKVLVAAMESLMGEEGGP